MPALEPSLPGRARFLGVAVAACSLLAAPAVLADAPHIKLEVDAADAPRKILHARLEFPASPGPLTLVYPKWLPGHHAPNGPITDLTGLKMRAAGQDVPWHRDPEDMHAFNLEVPVGAASLQVTLDYLLPAGADGSASVKVADVCWNEVLLYPKGAKARDLQFAAALRLPDGWQFGTALTPISQSGNAIQFGTVSLETLVDSPVIAGAYFRTVDLSPGAVPPHFLHIVADSAAAMELKPENDGSLARLVPETAALFGARHYRAYHFLLTLSDHVAHFGLEHHESSDNREAERYLVDADLFKVRAGLLPHELIHSWNGKYRRPAGLATPDFQQPMHGELLWVYEGLTDYLDGVLSVRCGLWTEDDYRQRLALDAARLDREPGRTWRPLADTAVAAQLLYDAARAGTAWRRSVDFYPEGALIWLEADTLIRQQTRGKLSLDDFCRGFCGGRSGPPRVVTYTLDDVLNALNEIASHDWRGFFQSRVYATTTSAPLGGIENAGWRLAYTNTLSPMLKSMETAQKFTDLRYSLGLTLKEDGAVQDVIPGSPAAKAGVAPAMNLLAVNGRRWTAELLRTAIQHARTNSSPIELLFEDDDYFQTCKLDYHEGEKYPQLQRNSSKPDLLAQILKPLAPAK
ncbi:MAG TPA: M61 family peptidase [Candidatus Paceibacterota bacterium]|nr:M61 family peptidase [Verrucomicrobiota bacterium]HSA12667.1 M61 family peptidase [Candidatus Paceibacterota bacterium]